MWYKKAEWGGGKKKICHIAIASPILDLWGIVLNEVFAVCLCVCVCGDSH